MRASHWCAQRRLLRAFLWPLLLFVLSWTARASSTAAREGDGAGTASTALDPRNPALASEPGLSDSKRAGWSRYFEDGRWILSTTLYTRHFTYNPDHNNNQNTVDLEHWMANGWLQGAAYLRNSFDQPIGYVYIGKAWLLSSQRPSFYFKLTGGIVYGYKGEHKDKVPFNIGGFAPVLLPSFGFATRRLLGEVMLLGTNGLLVNFGITLN